MLAVSLAPARALGEIYDVSENAGFQNALFKAEEGDRILLRASAEPYTIDLRKRGAPLREVTIASYDPNAPASIATANITGAEALTLENLRFDSPAPVSHRNRFRRDVIIEKSADIRLRNIVMHGTARGALYPGHAPDARSASAIAVKEVDGFVLEESEISHYFAGVGVLESRNVRIVGNDIHSLQGDGVQLGGVQHVLVSGNHIHDILGGEKSITHNDMIQLWSTNTVQVSSDVAIHDNFLDAGDGKATQSIWMRNELVDKSGGRLRERFYRNFTITENVIYNGHPHGVAVGEIDGLIIANNTLIDAPTAMSLVADKPGGVSKVGQPSIRVAERSTNVTIRDNVTARIFAPEGAEISGNLLVDYSDRGSSHYVGNLFVNAAGGSVGLRGLSAKPGGLLDGARIGAARTQLDPRPETLRPLFITTANQEDPALIRFDAGLTAGPHGRLGPDDASFTWIFEDGTSEHGQAATRRFAEPGRHKVTLRVAPKEGEPAEWTAHVLIRDPLLLDIEAVGGALQDRSSHRSPLSHDPARLGHGDGYAVGPGAAITVARSSLQVFGLPQFSLSFGLRRFDARAGEGVLAMIHNAMSLRLDRRGELDFKIETAEGGESELRSLGANLQDESWRHVLLSFDGLAGDIRLYVDGVEVGRETGAYGRTKPLEKWPLSFGGPFKKGGATVSLRSIEMRAEPASPAEAWKRFKAFQAELARDQ